MDPVRGLVKPISYFLNLYFKLRLDTKAGDNVILLSVNGKASIVFGFISLSTHAQGGLESLLGSNPDCVNI